MGVSILPICAIACLLSNSFAWETPTHTLVPLPGDDSLPSQQPQNGNFSGNLDSVLDYLELIANVVKELQTLSDVAKTELPEPLSNFTNTTLFDFAVGGLAYAGASSFLSDNVRGTEVTDKSVFMEFIKVTHYTFGIYAKGEVDWTKQEDPAAALAEILQIPQSDILAYNVTDQLYAQPWYMAVDHDDQRLYLVTRGSVSAADWSTDAVGLCVEMKNGAKAHLGFYRSAQNLIKYAGPHIKKAAQENPSYKLHVTGHSLGAGVCSISSLLLKEVHAEDILDGISLEANCISTPPALDPETAQRIGNYTYTLFLQDDVVVRSSVHNIANLVYSSKILGATSGALFEAVLKRFCSNFPNTFFCKPRDTNETVLVDPDFMQDVGAVGTYCKLEVPGVLYQIQRNRDGQFSMVTSGEAGAQQMAGVILIKNPQMVEDHLDENIEHALKALAGTDAMATENSPDSAGNSLQCRWALAVLLLVGLF